MIDFAAILTNATTVQTLIRCVTIIICLERLTGYLKRKDVDIELKGKHISLKEGEG